MAKVLLIMISLHKYFGCKNYDALRKNAFKIIKGTGVEIEKALKYK